MERALHLLRELCLSEPGSPKYTQAMRETAELLRRTDMQENSPERTRHCIDLGTYASAELVAETGELTFFFRDDYLAQTLKRTEAQALLHFLLKHSKLLEGDT